MLVRRLGMFMFLPVWFWTSLGHICPPVLAMLNRCLLQKMSTSLRTEFHICFLLHVWNWSVFFNPTKQILGRKAEWKGLVPGIPLASSSQKHHDSNLERHDEEQRLQKLSFILKNYPFDWWLNWVWEVVAGANIAHSNRLCCCCYKWSPLDLVTLIGRQYWWWLNVQFLQWRGVNIV